MKTPDPYDHVREAFHTVADGLMGWEDPPSVPESRSNGLRRSTLGQEIALLERAGECAMRAREVSLGVELFAFALKLRAALGEWES